MWAVRHDLLRKGSKMNRPFSGPSCSTQASALLALVFVCFRPVVSSAFQADTPDERKRGPQQTVIRISKETTRIIAPLDPQGFVDYARAIDARSVQAVTPGNNYEVIVRKVIRFDDPADAPWIQEYSARMKIPVPDLDRPAFQRCLDFLQSLPGHRADQKTGPRYERISSRPWSAASHPEAARWVMQNGKFLDQLVAGSRRARYYFPYRTQDPDEDDPPIPRVMGMIMFPAFQMRDVGEGLSVRAMKRIGAGEIDQAWSDIQALHRITRHLENRFTVIEGIVAARINQLAFRAEVQILNSPALTDRQARRFLADLSPVPAGKRLADRIDVGERFAGLDAVQTLANYVAGPKFFQSFQKLFRGLKVIEQLTAISSDRTVPFSVAGRDVPVRNVATQTVEKPVSLSIDWNVTLTVLNDWYDRYVAACREPDIQRRHVQCEAISTDLKMLTEAMSDTGEFRRFITDNGAPGALGTNIGGLLATRLLTPLEGAQRVADAVTARRQISRTAFALELYRREIGSFPESLAGLAPEYLPAIPEDSFSGRSLKYVVNDRGCLLYSVGFNGIDDKGRTRADASQEQAQTTDWDDICMRIDQN